MIGDLVARLRIDSKEFDTNLKKSTEQIKKMKDAGKSVDSALGSLGNTFKSLAPTVTAVSLATYAFNDALSLSETATDNFGRNVSALKTLVSGYIQELTNATDSTEDFFGFIKKNSFWGVFNGGQSKRSNSLEDAATEAYNATDYFGTNELISSRSIRELNTKFQEQLNISRDLTKSAKERNEAYNQAKKYSNDIAKLEGERKRTATEALKSELNRLAVIKGYMVTQEDINNIASMSSAADLDRYKEMYKGTARGDFYDTITDAKGLPMVNKYLGIITEADDKTNQLNRQLIRVNNTLGKVTEDKEVVIRFKEVGIEQYKEKLDKLNFELTLQTDPKAKAKIEEEIAELTRERKLTIQYYLQQNPIQTQPAYLPQEVEDPDLPDKIDIPINFQLPDISGEVKEYTEAISEMGNSVESIFSNIGSMIGGTSGKIVGWVGSAIGSISELIAKYGALAIANQGTLPFPENLVAIASTVAAITAAIASFPKFADGGIVGGNSYSGDKILAGLNSGEMVLNAKQQAALFSQLNAGGRGLNGQVEFVIKGQNLYGVLNNYNSKMNKVR